jgi:hypothetical protein
LGKIGELADDDFVVRLEKPNPKLCSIRRVVVMETRYNDRYTRIVCDARGGLDRENHQHLAG